MTLFGVVLAALGVFSAAALGVGLGPALLLVCAWYMIWSGTAVIRSARGAQIVNLAFARGASAQYDEALALLDEADARIKTRYLQRATQLQRAHIALQRGELDQSIEAATRASAAPSGVLGREYQRTYAVNARAIRALSNALAGHDAAALEDADHAEADERTDAAGLGRVLLARLAVAERSGERGRMRELCRGPLATFVTGELSPRERALYRTYRIQAFATGPGAYREQRHPDAAPEAPTLATSEPSLAPARKVAADPKLVETLAAQRTASGWQSARRMGVRALGAWLGLMVVLFSIWRLLEGTRTHGVGAHERARTGETFLASSMTVVALVLGGTILWAVLRVRRALVAQRAHVRARRALWLDDGARFVEQIQVVRSSGLVQNQVMADAFEADRAYAHADFDRAVQLTTSALDRLKGAPAVRAMNIDLLVTGITERRACALAALGRQTEARAELALLLSECPSYAYRARAEYTVELLALISAGDLDAARELARACPQSAQISAREEMLGDLVRMSEAASLDERSRVKSELAESPRLRAFVDAVAPGLAERVTAAIQVRFGEPLEREEGDETSDPVRAATSLR